MTIEQLKATLTRKENVAIEYKTAKGGIPANMWETVSAFANTNGGVIIFGVAEKNKVPVVDGLTEDEVIDLKKKFWDLANNRQKLNLCFFNEDDVHEAETEKGWVLVIEVIRVDYRLRPIYINGTPYGNTFRRNHEGDYHCTDDEVRQMFADANHQTNSADGRILCNFTIEDVDLATLKKYRMEFDRRHDKHPWSQESDLVFLKKIGAYRTDRRTREEGFTVAGMLMFGKTESINDQECLPHYSVDYREHMTDDPNVRWTDRIYPDGRWSANLYEFYNRILDKLYEPLPKPFIMDEDGKTRLEYTTAHISIREALANSLIHAAYTQLGNVTVDRWKDRVVMSNPGTMLVSVDQFFIGQQSVCRNPILQNMFVRLGIGEKAGSGADIIVKGWKDNGWKKPLIEEKERPDRVVLTLTFEKDEVSESLSQSPSQSLSWHEAVTKLTLSGSLSVALSWEQERPLFVMLKEPVTAKDIRTKLGFNDSSYFKKNYLDPLIAEGIVLMTKPDKPTSPSQRYFLSEKGRLILETEDKGVSQPVMVSPEKIKRFVTEMKECIGQYPIRLPEMKDEYKSRLTETDVRCFPISYKHPKNVFEASKEWIYMMPDLYLNEIQQNIWHHYNIQWWLKPADVCYSIRFSEIKDAFERLGLNKEWAVVTSFHLNTYDSLYGGENLVEAPTGYEYKGMSIYHVPAHEDFMIIMRADCLPRYEAKKFEGENPEFKLIDEENLIYSNLLNLREEEDGYGLNLMRDLRFYFPKDEDFHYVRLNVDRMEREKSDIQTIKKL